MAITISGDSPNFTAATTTTATVTTLNAPTGSLVTQNGMTGIVKAWVYFQGGNGNTAGVILGSYNVSSITVNGTGDFTLNFTTAMPDANYAMAGSGKFDSGGATSSSVAVNIARTTNVQLTTSCRICTFSTSGTSYTNFQFASAMIIGN